MTTLPEQLAEDVFLCLSDNRIVFLDLRQDRYLCLNRRNSQTAIGLLTDFSRADVKPMGEKPATDRASNSEEIRRVVNALTVQGLLAQDGTNGNAAAPVQIQAPVNTLLFEESSSIPSIRPGHWAAFLYASLKASWKLHSYSMHRTVQAIRNRKQKNVISRMTDHDALRELVAIFHQLRPFYVRKYLCLYDSLALVEFLAHYRFYPQWVFGVTTEPFNAHCWVQQFDYVLNDTVERVNWYTPIMVI